MQQTGSDDIITKNASPVLGFCVAMTEQVQNLAMELAEMKMELDRRLPKPIDTSRMKIQVRTDHEDHVDACYFSVPVFVDTPGLQSLQDFASKLCNNNAGNDEKYHSIAMSITPWSDCRSPEAQLKRPISYIDGVVGADTIDPVVVAQDLEKAWTGAVVSTIECELVLNTRCDFRITGLVQATSHMNVWAELILQAEDSAWIHPDGTFLYRGVQWAPLGNFNYDEDPRVWFAEFTIAIIKDNIMLSSPKARHKVEELVQRIPAP